MSSSSISTDIDSGICRSESTASMAPESYGLIRIYSRLLSGPEYKTWQVPLDTTSDGVCQTAVMKFEKIQSFNLELWENVVNEGTGMVAIQRRMYPEEKPLMNSCFLLSRPGYERRFEIKEKESKTIKQTIFSKNETI